jgi:hypothetical protein
MRNSLLSWSRSLEVNCDCAQRQCILAPLGEVRYGVRGIALHRRAALIAVDWPAQIEGCFRIVSSENTAAPNGSHKSTRREIRLMISSANVKRDCELL